MGYRWVYYKKLSTKRFSSPEINSFPAVLSQQKLLPGSGGRFSRKEPPGCWRQKKTTPTILLIFPPAGIPLKVRSLCFTIPLGGAYIAAYLKKHKIPFYFFTTVGPISLNRCIAGVVDSGAPVVGFTVYNSNYTLCQLIAGELKKLLPGIIVVFGGPTPTVQSRVILERNPWVDIIVRGEGEETCRELLETLENVGFNLECARLEGVLGISYRRGSEIKENALRHVFDHHRLEPGFLDKYPSPYLEGVVVAADMGVITARGCNCYCVYCNCPVVSGRRIITHSVERVIDELDYISRRCQIVGPVDIFDDAFTLFPERAILICEALTRRKIKLPLGCATRCDCLSEELLDLIKAAGFRTVGISLESAVPRVLRAIGKVRPPGWKGEPGFETEQAFIENFKKYAAYGRKIGIEVIHSSIMIGLPGETVDEARQTVELIGELIENKTLNFYAHNDFRVYAGTPIFNHYAKYGIGRKVYGDGIHFRTVHVFDTGLVKPVPRSNHELEGLALDRLTLKTLALVMSGQEESEKNRDCFRAVVLDAARITDELAVWLQKNLELNGILIQVYPGKDVALANDENDVGVLIDYCAPVVHRSAYFKRENDVGEIEFVPLRMVRFGERCGMVIRWVRVGEGMKPKPGGGIVEPFRTVCWEGNLEDMLKLYHILEGISSDWVGQGGRLERWCESDIYPYWSSLCRWEKTAGNCHLLEIAIIDNRNNIRTCWHGDAVGRVGMSYQDIIGQLKKTRQEVERQRGCQVCSWEKGCSRCLFFAGQGGPGFDLFCGLKHGFDTGEAASIFRSIDFLKEIDLNG